MPTIHDTAENLIRKAASGLHLATVSFLHDVNNCGKKFLRISTESLHVSLCNFVCSYSSFGCNTIYGYSKATQFLYSNTNTTSGVDSPDVVGHNLNHFVE